MYGEIKFTFSSISVLLFSFSIFFSLTKTLPEVGFINPRIIPIVVVLPQPLGPKRPTIEPLLILKFIFLTASIETRATRRYKQLKDREFNVSLPALIKDLDARDKRDKRRENSPLVIPEGAFVIETDNLTVIEVKNTVNEKVNKTYGTNI